MKKAFKQITCQHLGVKIDDEWIKKQNKLEHNYLKRIKIKMPLPFGYYAKEIRVPRESICVCKVTAFHPFANPDKASF
jgi:hypothetical protein